MIVTVITINLNNAVGLEKTIRSVLQQTYSSVEYIIVDGGSTDASDLIIRKYSSGISLSISEKDNGIYDAMNKGIKFANGDYLIFLNSGDFFYNRESIESFVSQHDGCEIVFGDLEFIETKSRWIGKYPSKLSFSFFRENTLPHPSCFIKRSVFEYVGAYETHMLISADWGFFIKAICLYNASYKHLPYVVSSFDHHGISSDQTNQDLIRIEKERFLLDNFSLFIDDYTQYDDIKKKFYNLKNSRLRKYLAYFFRQLKI